MSEHGAATSPGSEINPSARLHGELASIRTALRMLDDVDLRTSELVANLAETVRTLIELRAVTSLELSAALRRIDDTVAAQAAAHQTLLAELGGQVSAAHHTAADLASLAAELDARHRALIAKIDRAADEFQPQASAAPAPADPATPAVRPQFAVRPPSARPTPPEPDTIVLRFDNVDSAATALSLQRFVSRIPGVIAVTGRHFLGTRLRLDVGIRGDLLYDDLFDWPGGELAMVSASEQGADLAIRRLRPIAHAAEVGPRAPRS